MTHPIRPLSIIYNRKSGFHRQQLNLSEQAIIKIFQDFDFDVLTYEIHADASMQQIMHSVIERHMQYADHGIVVAAGGDGTLNSIAQYLLGSPIALGILPLGTFNYVARVLNIPLETQQAIKVIALGSNQSVHVARINEHIYLNNASLGLYPLFIKKREKYNQRFGRLSLNAYSSALEVLIRDRKELKLEIHVDGQKYPVKSPLIFFGNNQLQLADLGLKIAKAAEQGKIAGIIVAKSDKCSLFKMLYQLIKGRIDQAKDVYSFAADHVEITAKRKAFTVAIDGEIVELRTPIRIHIDKKSLLVRVPT